MKRKAHRPAAGGNPFLSAPEDLAVRSEIGMLEVLQHGNKITYLAREPSLRVNEARVSASGVYDLGTCEAGGWKEGGDEPPVKVALASGKPAPMDVFDLVDAEFRRLTRAYVEAYPNAVMPKDGPHWLKGFGSGKFPRYHDLNDDPWMAFCSHDEVVRVDTEYGQLAVGVNEAFQVQVGCGHQLGVAPIAIDGIPLRISHDVRFGRDGELVPHDEYVRKNPSPFPYGDTPGVSVQPRDFVPPKKFEASPVPPKPPAHVVRKAVLLAEKVAADYMAEHFHKVREAGVGKVDRLIARLTHEIEMIAAAQTRNVDAQVGAHYVKLLKGLGREIGEAYVLRAQVATSDRAFTRKVGQ